jgi:phospholipid/cholesterol/gamma-HCH transport system permease protein
MAGKRVITVPVRGDLVIATTHALYARLRAACEQHDVDKVVLDLAEAGRLDSSAIAVIQLCHQAFARAGKELELVHPGEAARALLAALPDVGPPGDPPAPAHAIGLEPLGARVLAAGDELRALGHLIGDTIRRGIAALGHRARLPAGAIGEQIVRMGGSAVAIIGLLSFLLGMSITFQGAVQLQRFGARVYVSDLVGLAMVRELAPMMTAVMVAGRTGAAIAAELGTMRVGSEIDALQVMGISPVRFLVVPRLVALTVVGPILTLMGMFLGIVGGLFVATFALRISPEIFWLRLTERLTLGDFGQGLAKSLGFAWIIGLAAAHLGLRTQGGASSVGLATTRAVVVAVFFIIVFDAGFETLSTLARRA